MDGTKKSWEMQKVKKLFNFLHKTNFNAELQESDSINQIL